MKKASPKKAVDDLRPEYEEAFFRELKPNRLAASLPKGHVVAVLLEDDVAQVFDSSEAVNRFLRSAIQAMPNHARRVKKTQTLASKSLKRRAV